MDLMFIITLGSLVGSFLGLSWFAGSDAPYVATNLKQIKGLLKKAGVKKEKIFYELGSGDGRVVLEAAKLGAKANGIEQSWVRVWYSRFKAQKNGIKNTFFLHGNIFDRDYFPADIVYIFLLPKGVERLEKKLQQELKKGAVVITQTFHFKNWKPYLKVDLSDKQNPQFLGESKIKDEFWLYKKN